MGNGTTAVGARSADITLGKPQQTGARGAQFEAAGRLKSGIKEASDVVALPGGRLLVVGDTSDKVGLIDADGSVKKLKLPGLPNGKPSQMEGVAYDSARHNLFISREESREVWRFDWNPDKRADPEFKKKYDVKHLGGPTNKGIEGLSYLPGEFSPTGRPQLLGTKEGKPRELVMFDDNGGKTFSPVKLEKQVLDVCKDFSAIAIDPTTGHLFISSDESSTVAELEIPKKRPLTARLINSFPLRDDKNKPLQRIEGLALNEKGDLFVLTENDGELLRLARKK